MSEPTNQGGQGNAPAKPKLRPGQVVTFRHPDPYTGQDLTGRALVLRVPEEGAVDLLPLSELHLEVESDNLTPAKLEDVLPPALVDRLEGHTAPSS